jgi:hypothetical protein
VRIATSTDLLNWTFVKDYGRHFSQPYLVALDDGGFVLALQADNTGDTSPYSWISFRHYADRDALFRNASDRVFNAPHTQVAPGQFVEGTPNIYSATLSPDIDHSVVDVGFDYWNGNVDRQAHGTLVDFATWNTVKETQIDDALLEYGLKGNITDRDSVTFRGLDFNVHEGAYVKNDFAAWRPFLWDRVEKRATPLNIRTHGGSTSFGAPSLTIVKSPSGKRALVVSFFVFGEGAGSDTTGQLLDESGQLLYYKTFGPDSGPNQK